MCDLREGARSSRFVDDDTQLSQRNKHNNQVSLHAADPFIPHLKFRHERTKEISVAMRMIPELLSMQRSFFDDYPPSINLRRSIEQHLNTHQTFSMPSHIHPPSLVAVFDWASRAALESLLNTLY